MKTGHPLALRVAFSPSENLSNSPSFAQGETCPLSNIDSEVGQELRGWELGCSHRGARRPLETMLENTVSRIGLKLLKTDVLLTKQRHEINVRPALVDVESEVHFQDPRIFCRMWCNSMKENFLLMKDFLYVCECVSVCAFNPWTYWVSGVPVSSQGDWKQWFFYPKAFGISLRETFELST